MAMEAWSFAYAAVSIVAVSFLLKKVWNFRKTGSGQKVPPIYRGWLPWFGCAFEFKRRPFLFMEEKRKELGPIYTLLMGGEHFTVITDPDCIHTFFNDPALRLEEAICKQICRVSAMTHSTFLTHHCALSSMLKARLGGRGLSSMMPALIQGFGRRIDMLDSGEYDLLKMLKTVVYPTVLITFFGCEDKVDVEEVGRLFDRFDSEFDAGTHTPSILMGEWRHSRHRLLQMLHHLTTWLRGQNEDPKPLVKSVLDIVDNAPDTESAVLMLLWAAMANLVPAAFWTLAMVLDDERVAQKVKKEVVENIGTTGEVDEKCLPSMPFLKCCILEATRLRGPGALLRYAVKDTTLKDFAIPANSTLVIPAYWMQRNPDLFPEPDKFLPERWQTPDLERNVLAKGFVSFGDGPFRCPGRHMAMAEMRVILALLFQRFDFTLKSPVPEMNFNNLKGVPQSTGPCFVQVKKL